MPLVISKIKYLWRKKNQKSSVNFDNDNRGVRQPIEYEIEDDEVIYFLHIPKTAGLTLYNILNDHFDYDEIYPASSWQEWEKYNHKTPSKIKHLRGHFGYEIRQITNKKPIILTMLRDPIERTISQYYYLKERRHSNENIEKLYFSNNRTLEDNCDELNKKFVFL